MTTFQSLGLGDVFLQAIADLGFEQPSEVQQKTIPLLLSQETDIVSLAQTGTGKTAAFGFPMLQKIRVESRDTQGLILSPTRELCLQITQELKLYGKYLKGLNVVAIYGGASITEQARQIKNGAQVIVATPGRMKDMIGRGMIDISKIEYCVLDEADEMLNMGFYEDITEILSYSPQDKNTWLFSATMPKEVAAIAREFMHQPQEITVGAKNVGASSVAHEYYTVAARDRYQALKRLADAHPDIFSVVFCRTKRDTQKVAEMLIEDGYNAAALHGDLSQNQRDLVMKSFRSSQIQMLVATDVAARGIDVDDITHVINYQLPDEIETYTHRSGRTGRAGKTGVSMVIISKSEGRKIKAIEKIIQKSFVAKTIPSGIEICEKQLFHLASNIAQTEINHEIDPYLPAIGEVLKDFDKDQLIKKFFSVEFSRFFNYYKKAKDLNVAHTTDTDHSAGPEKSDNSLRFFINLGRKDGLAWMDLKDLIREVTGLGKDEVFHVDTMDSFSFFNTDSKHEKLVNQSFEGVFFHDRAIEIERSDDRGSRGKFKGGKGSGRKSKKGKAFGGEKRGASSFESSGRPKRGKKQDATSPFKGKSRRRGERPDVPGTRGKRRRR